MRILDTIGLALCLVSCSLVVERRDVQCESDSDCADFPGAACDVGQGVCVSASANGACPPPVTNIELLNACTDAACSPFDNRARLTKLPPDGKLPPFP